MESALLDATGHRRSPATMPGCHCGRPPRNKGEHYSAAPPTVEEIVAVMRTISEALALHESDLIDVAVRSSSVVGRVGSALRSGWTAAARKQLHHAS
jgi:hypothetical protein